MINNQNYRKIFYIFFVNVFIIICIIIFANFLVKVNWERILVYKTYSILDAKENDETDINKYETEPTKVKFNKLTIDTLNEYCAEERVKFGEKYSKKPVVVLGGSYAYGHGLKKQQSFSYLLSELSHRPVYNFSKCGGEAYDGIINLSNYTTKFEKNNQIRNAEYYVYIYMHDHINRYMRADNVDRYLADKLNNPKTLNEKIYKYLYNFPICKLILLDIYLMKLFYDPTWEGPNIKNCEEYLKDVMVLIKSKIYKESPNAKIIIVIYDQKIADMYTKTKIKFDSEIINSNIWNELQNEYGIKIVHTKDITGFTFDKDYKLKVDIADWHPNAKAWKVFTSKFTEEYIK